LVVGDAIVVGRAVLFVAVVVVGGIVVFAVALVVDMGFSFVDGGVSCDVHAGGSPLERVLWRQEDAWR
jgi:ABC-type proline/glycine betaine transport system permease subunit